MYGLLIHQVKQKLKSEKEKPNVKKKKSHQSSKTNGRRLRLKLEQQAHQSSPIGSEIPSSGPR